MVPSAGQGGAGGPIRVGTSGWSYVDWEGRFYPPEKPRGFDELAYHARYFDAVEVNSSFYRPPSARAATSWVRRTPSDFEFTFKLYQRFTHEREKPWTADEVAEYRRGIEPVREAGRLGAVLVQFPWSFRADADSRRHLEAICRDFGDLPLVVEVRHAGWMAEGPMRFLQGLGVGFCNIDQPPSRGGVPPTALATSPVGYVRLHGRNGAAWFKKDAGADARYDYLYSEAELDEWIERIRQVARASEKTYVFTNNHYRGQAPANALQILSRLSGGRVPVPPPLVETYPFLESVAADEPARGEQGRLF